MKHFLILSIFIFIFSNPLLSQAGFQKSLKDGYSNALVGTLISNDTLIIQHFLNDELKGFFPSILIVDTFGNVNKKFIEKKLINNTAYSREFGRLVAAGKKDVYYSLLIKRNEILLLTLDKNEELTEKTYSLRPNIDDSYFPTSILVDESGSIYILGNIQYKESLAYTVGFLLKLDQDGNQIYWKLYEKGNDQVNLIGSFFNKIGNIVLYGNHIKNNFPKFDTKAIIFKIGPEDGSLIKSSIMDNKFIVGQLYGLFENKNNTYSAVNLRLDYNYHNDYLPYLNILDSNFITIKTLPFGTKETQLTPQWPSHSAQDSSENVLVATRGFVFKSFPQLDDSNAVEVMTLTKFSREGDIIWETIDTVDFRAMGSKYDRVSRQTGITSVNVASSGRVFVTGYYNDIDDIFYVDTITKAYYWAYDSLSMQWYTAVKDTLGYDTITQIERGIGFLFKYDKNGCRVANCRLTNSNDIADNVRSGTFTLYPNPTNDVLRIKQYGITGDTDVMITDQTGTTLMKGYLRDGLSEVDVSHFKSGMYFITIVQDGKILNTEKFVKR